MNIARGYMTLANAARAAGGRPILRLLADPQQLYIVIPSLATSIEILTADSPKAGHKSAGKTTAMGIVEGELRQRPWSNLRIVADAANPNNCRITADNDRHICKVYGHTPDEARFKAEIILAALSDPAHG